MDAVAQIAESLRQARKHRGLTQEQVSELSGVHPTEISRIENGHRDSQISTVFKLAQAFGLTPGEFIDRSWIAPDEEARD
ncbi:MAG: helix-turn-helix domain-containing protein [Solirubrobacteraceae bacterium]